MKSTASVVSVRLEMVELQKLQALARVESTTVGSLIRQAVSGYLQRRLTQPELQRQIEAARAQYDEVLAQLRPSSGGSTQRFPAEPSVSPDAAEISYGRSISTVTPVGRGTLAAAEGKVRKPSEHGRLFLDRGNYQFSLNGVTTVEVKEHDQQLLVRWVDGPAVRIVSETEPLDRKFRQLPPPHGRDFVAVLKNGLELVA